MRILSQGRLLVENIGRANTFSKRLMGWFNPMFKDASGVMIYPCNAVHTLGMGKPIDVVFLDNDKVVCRVVEQLRPFSMAMCKSARYVLELPVGKANDYGFFEGRSVEFMDR